MCEVATGYWTVDRHLEAGGRDDAREAWRKVIEGGRIGCPVLLDMLVRLAAIDADPTPRDLEMLARADAEVGISGPPSVPCQGPAIAEQRLAVDGGDLVPRPFGVGPGGDRPDR